MIFGFAVLLSFIYQSEVLLKRNLFLFSNLNSVTFNSISLTDSFSASGSLKITENDVELLNEPLTELFESNSYLIDFTGNKVIRNTDNVELPISLDDFITNSLLLDALLQKEKNLDVSNITNEKGEFWEYSIKDSQDISMVFTKIIEATLLKQFSNSLPKNLVITGGDNLSFKILINKDTHLISEITISSSDKITITFEIDLNFQDQLRTLKLELQTENFYQKNEITEIVFAQESLHSFNMFVDYLKVLFNFY